MTSDFFCQITMVPIYPLWIRKNIVKNKTGMTLRKKIPTIFSVTNHNGHNLSISLVWWIILFWLFKIFILIFTLKKQYSFFLKISSPYMLLEWHQKTNWFSRNHKYVLRKFCVMIFLIMLWNAFWGKPSKVRKGRLI